MILSPSLTNLFFISAVFFGLLICFFGYRILRFLVAVTGFLVGSFLGIALYLEIAQQSVLSLTKGSDLLIILALGLAGGLVLAIILLFLYSTGVFLIGALFGILLASGVLALFNMIFEPILYLIPAILGGILTLFLQRFMIIVMTSIMGAWLSVIGVLYIISSQFDPLSPNFLNSLGEIEVYRLILGWIALAGLGFITQYFIFPKRLKTNESVESSNDA